MEQSFASVWHHESLDILSQPFLSNRKQSVVVSKRSQEGLSDDSPTVKAKSRAMNLVSYRNLSIAGQNSQNASELFGWVTEQTNRPPASGRPSQGNTGGSLSLRSHEKPPGITSEIGSEHSEWNVSSSSFGRPLRGTRNQESWEVPGREHDCSSSFGRPLRGTRTPENRTNPELSNMEVTNTEHKKKVFQNLQNKLAGVQNLPKFAMEANETNILMWRWFVVSSMKAVVHVDPKVWTYPRIWVWWYWELRWMPPKDW